MRIPALGPFGLIGLLFLTSGVLVNCTATDFGGVGGKQSGKKAAGDADEDNSADDKDDGDTQGTDGGIDSDDDANDTGTVDDPTFDIDAEGYARQSFKVASEGTVDIAFIIDTSGSMGEEIAALQSNMNRFFRDFIDEAKIDFQLFLVGGKVKFNVSFDPTITSHDKVEAIVKAVGSHNALAVAQDILSSGGGSKLQFRDKAIKELVFVTDDEARSPNQTGFETFLANRTDEVHVNGIVGIAAANNASCKIASIGSSYIGLAASEKHKGMIQDLCAQDWGKLLNELKKSIEQRVTLEFDLKATPLNAAKISVAVAGEVLEDNEFDYRSDDNSIKIKSGSAPKVGDRVVITFEVEA